jgi:hypothetical protein
VRIIRWRWDIHRRIRSLEEQINATVVGISRVGNCVIGRGCPLSFLEETVSGGMAVITNVLL